MSVNGIRKHCTDEDVVNLAKILIKNWKKLLGRSSFKEKKITPLKLKFTPNLILKRFIIHNIYNIIHIYSVT